MMSEVPYGDPNWPADGVKKVADTMTMFTKAYPKPVVPAYRSVVNDILVTTHLTVIQKEFKYDPLFALGMVTIFDNFFKAYPPPSEVDPIFSAMITSLDFDVATMKSDAKTAEAWAEGKSEEELLAMFEAPDASPVGATISAVKGNEKFAYSRVWAVGLFKMMNMAGVEPISNEVLVKWATAIGLDKSNFAVLESDYDLYSSSLTKLRELEQLFKEIEIREKKKLAERLEAKAAAAVKAAEEAAAAAAGTPEPVEPAEPGVEQKSAQI